MPLEPNIRLGQTNSMIRNNSEERRKRISKLIGNNETSEALPSPRNRHERRIRGDYNRNYQQINNTDNLFFDDLRVIANNEVIYSSNLFEYFIGCINSNQYISKYIHGHNYKPLKFNFHKYNNDDESNMFFGLELEIDNGGETDKNAKYIQEYLGEDNCYIVRDGSLINGLEIVTHPCTINYHKSLNYDELFEELKNRGYNISSQSGFHVHVNRSYFDNNKETIAKIIYLCQNNWDVVEMISHREENRFSHRFNSNVLSMDYNELISLIDCGIINNKYTFLNLNHDDTIEFRMFRGTMKKERIIEVLKMVKSIVDICHNNSYEYIKQFTKKDFIKTLGR